MRQDGFCNVVIQLELPTGCLADSHEQHNYLGSWRLHVSVYPSAPFPHTCAHTAHLGSTGVE